MSDPKVGNALLWTAEDRIIYTLADSTKWGIAFSSFASTAFNVWAVPVSAAGKQTGQPVRIAVANGNVSRLSMAESTGTLAFVNEVKQMDVYVSEPWAQGAEVQMLLPRPTSILPLKE